MFKLLFLYVSRPRYVRKNTGVKAFVDVLKGRVRTYLFKKF